MQENSIQYSIIVPVYNIEAYLETCIRSVVSQSFRDFELILVDDGATDNSGMICDHWAALDHRIRVIHKENGGSSSARNAAIPEARGEYILFLDSDDYWPETDFLKKIHLRLQQCDSDVLSFNFQKVWETHTDTPYFSDSGIDQAGSFDAVSENIWIACAWNKVIRKALFENNDLYFMEGITSEDIDWCTRLALYAQRFDYVDLCGVSYRQRAGSISRAMTLEKTQCLYENIIRSMKLAEQADEEKQRLLQPYLAYQVGTLLQAISQLPKKQDRYEMARKSKSLLHLLAISENSKIKLLHRVNQLVGIRGCILLLRLRSRLR